jgi:hypothetical protein
MNVPSSSSTVRTLTSADIALCIVPIVVFLSIVSVV